MIEYGLASHNVKATDDEAFPLIVDLIKRSNNIVALTGAGISTGTPLALSLLSLLSSTRLPPSSYTLIRTFQNQEYQHTETWREMDSGTSTAWRMKKSATLKTRKNRE